MPKLFIFVLPWQPHSLLLKCKDGVRTMSDHKIELEKQAELQEAKRKEIEKNYKDYCLSHNKRPVTRRQLLSAGVLSFSATMTLPTLAGMLLPSEARAQALECPSAAGASSMASFVTINLAGGMAMAANFVPQDQGGQFLPSYNKMGLGDGQLPIDNEFGNVPFAGQGISRLLVGIRNTASAATLGNTAFVAIPVRSRDDSSMNPFDASGMVAKAGLIGTDLPNMGNSSSDTGIRQMYAKVKPPTPLVVGNYNDIAGALALGVTGPMRNWSDEQKTRLVRLVKNLSSSQVEKVNRQAGGRMLATLVNCAMGKNVELSTQPPPPVDVRQDAALAAVWGVQQNTGTNNREVIFGSMVNAGLMGNAGTIGLNMGGYDYHNGTRTTGDTRDEEAGEVIGRTLESASVLNKKVFIYVTSDGSVVSPVSDQRDAPWRSDRGSAGCAYIIAYDPAGRPQTSGHQIGHFTEGQAADDQFVTGGNPELAAAAAFANYLKFNNRMDLLSPVIASTFTSSDLNKIIKFG